MQIEQALRDLTTAIDNLSVAIKSAKGIALVPTPSVTHEAAVAEIPPAPSLEPAPVDQPVTEADLRVAAQKLLHAKRLPDILRINKDFGIRRITECPPDRYAALLDALNAALADASGS